MIRAPEGVKFYLSRKNPKISVPVVCFLILPELQASVFIVLSGLTVWSVFFYFVSVHMFPISPFHIPPGSFHPTGSCQGVWKHVRGCCRNEVVTPEVLRCLVRRE